MKQITRTGIGLALSLGLLGLSAVAQSQSSSDTQSSSVSNSQGSSLGDYARQIKKTPGASKPKVFDNDNLPREEKLSIVGSAQSSAPDATAQNTESPEGKSAQAPADDKSAKEDKSAKSENKAEEKPPSAAPVAKSGDDDATKQAAWKQWGDKITGQKGQIDLMTRELDVAQREYQIRAAAMYADAGNRLRNQQNWDQQDTQYKQQIADKQKALDEAKQKLEDMQEDARKAGVPASVREP